MLTNQRGSVAVETAMTILFVMSFVIAGFSSLYASFAYVWIERTSYEAIVCLATKAQESECARDLRKSTERALPIGRVVDLRVHRTSNEARVDVRFGFDGKTLIHHKDSRKLPLLPSSGNSR